MCGSLAHRFESVLHSRGDPFEEKYTLNTRKKRALFPYSRLGHGARSAALAITSASSTVISVARWLAALCGRCASASTFHLACFVLPSAAATVSLAFEARHAAKRGCLSATGLKMSRLGSSSAWPSAAMAMNASLGLGFGLRIRVIGLEVRVRVRGGVGAL